MRIVAALTVLSLLLAPAAEAQQKKKGAGKKAKPAAAAPAPVVPKSYALPDPVLSVVPDTKKPTKLTKLTKEKAAVDYRRNQENFLKRYGTAGDRQAAYAIDWSMPIVEAPSMQGYVEAIANRLLAPACWAGPRPPVRFLIRGTPRLHARAYGSGIVELSTGLIEQMKFTDGLAFIIAHELGHILDEHEANRKGTEDTIGRLSNWTASGAVLADETRFDGNQLKAGNTDRVLTMKSDLAKSDVLLIGLAADVTASDLIAPSMSAGQEHEADRIALDLIVCARFSPQRAGEAMSLLVEGEQLPAARLKNFGDVAKQYAAGELIQDSSQNTETQLKNLGIAAVITVVVDAVTGTFEKMVAKRATAESRTKELAEYVEEVYGEMPLVIPAADTRLSAARADPQWRSLVTLADAVAPAVEQTTAPVLRNGTLPNTQAARSIASANKGLRTDPRMAASYQVAGYLAAISGDRVAARRHWQAGLASPWAARTMMMKLGILQIDSRDLPGVTNTLGVARRRLGDIPALLPLDVGRARLAGDMAGAEKLAARCITEGGRETYAECAVVLGYDAACAPRTPEGKAALSSAVTATQFAGLFELPRQQERAQKQKQKGAATEGRPKNCVDAV